MSTQTKKQQRIILTVAVSIAVLGITVLAFLGHKSEEVKKSDKQSFKKHTLASPLSSKTNEAHWIEKTQNAWKAEQEKSQELDKNIKFLSKEKEKQGLLLRSQKDEMAELKTMLAELKQQVVHLQAEKVAEEGRGNNNSQHNNAMLPRAGDETGHTGMEMDSGFIQYSAKLSKSTKPRIKTPDNYVFSNTFAKAVVLQGADASAGVLSQANPDIMIFQIVDDGVMPNKHKSHLKDCFVSASVVGDISSERGKLRLERLSCINANGTSIDIPVTGIVSDSKNGIRGRAVWRDEPMVKKAFWGNFWESLGNIGQQYSTDVSVSPLGSVSTIQQAKIPLAAVSSGGAGAAKMYAQYNIKRAEMYHPIIQLSPGVIVDVTFLKGFWLDGGTDSKEPEMPIQNPGSRFENQEPAASPEEKAANQFFYKNHSF
ncbi:TPA: TraB/VirB10 family protein [Legionella pneumophila]|nr:conjugal transfer protein TraB [Legionella pneumophila]HBD7410329.1 TraB/VirB10 family protein [Legionella pneumophila]HBD9405522.1 TraB/VirB10 family protein [Legionella pneumophila]HBI2968751.1 TraB/VirB10 family protein [Legionella pneumophila]